MGCRDSRTEVNGGRGSRQWMKMFIGVRPQLTFLFIVSHECRAYEIVKWELNKLILCDMSAFEQEYSQVCL